MSENTTTPRDADTCAYPLDTTGEHDHAACEDALAQDREDEQRTGISEAMGALVVDLFHLDDASNSDLWVQLYEVDTPVTAARQQHPHRGRCVECQGLVGAMTSSTGELYWNTYTVAEGPGFAITWCTACVPDVALEHAEGLDPA